MEKPKKKTILLVDDNLSLIELIKVYLQEAGYDVLTSQNGKMAQEIIYTGALDLCITDIKIPELNGIELLHWAKRERIEVPIILITGDSTLIEKKEAYDLGAKELLLKPFSMKDLQGLLKNIWDKSGPQKEKPASKKSPYLDPNNFMKVSLAEFLMGSISPYPVYLKLSNQKFIKIAHANEKMDKGQIEKYREKNIKHLYLTREDYAKYLGFSIKAEQAVLKKKNLSPQKKKKFMTHVGETILEKIYHEEIDPDTYKYAKDFVDTGLTLFKEVSEHESLLNILRNCGDHIYAHSLGVSIYSVMVAQQLGWHNSRNLSLIAIGGMLHDIGKKNLPEDIFDKEPSLLTEEEQKEIESHPIYGVEILNKIKTIPKEIMQIIMQHHEQINGTGYPFGLFKANIFPPALVVGVVNNFCNLIVTQNPTEQLSPKEAIQYMKLYHSCEVPKEIFKALTSLVTPLNQQKGKSQ